MCQIASLFLLQRLKGSMSGHARDFNNIETRAVIKFLQGKAPKEIHAILTETLGKIHTHTHTHTHAHAHAHAHIYTYTGCPTS